jgi:hypothetical protein
MVSTPDAALSPPSEPTPSVPLANVETPVNAAPGPIAIDNFSDVCGPDWLIVIRN